MCKISRKPVAHSLITLVLSLILTIPFITISPSALAQVPVYSEDFENGEAGWVAKDFTDAGGVFWTHATYGGSGVAWCGVDDPSYLNSPGYGNNWDMRLTKTINYTSVPGRNPGRITFDIQYDTEQGYDWICVQVSYDNGSNWDTMDCYSGTTNGAFVTKTLNWAAFVPPPVLVRFQFHSDANTSDKDGVGGFDSDGACRIDNVHVIDIHDNYSIVESSTFDTDLDGWIPSQSLGGGGPYRLDYLNPEQPENTDNFWGAFNILGSPHPFQFPYARPGESMVRIGIESPVIQIPLTDGGPLYLEFDYWSNLPLADYVFYDLEVAVPAEEDGGEFRSDWYIWYSSPPATGPEWRTHFWDLTDVVLYKDSGENEVRGSIIENGATTMQIRLVGMAYHYNPSGTHQSGPFFDDVRVLVPGDLGTLSGRVLADCPAPDTPLHGVKVVAYEPGTGTVAETAVTDADGNFEMTLFSAEYTLSLVRPLGYSTPSDEFAVTVLPGMTVEQDYHLSCLDIAYSPRSIGYWKHQVSEALGGQGNGKGPKKKDPKGGGDDEEDIVSPVCDLLDLIAAHFNNNELNQVIIYEPPASDLCRDKVGEASALLNLHGSQDMIARARQQLMALLLNCAAGNVHLTEVISMDGATVSQAITYCDNVIDDPDGDHETAKTIADLVNNGETVPADMIPLDTVQIAYRQGVPAGQLNLTSKPNPFNPMTTISFVLPEAASTNLRIYDVSGHLVRTLMNGIVQPGGHHEVVWNGQSDSGRIVAAGVYFCKLDAGEFSEIQRMTLIK
jgi:hypothetical protein